MTRPESAVNRTGGSRHAWVADHPARQTGHDVLHSNPECSQLGSALDTERVEVRSQTRDTAEWCSVCLRDWLVARNTAARTVLHRDEDCPTVWAASLRHARRPETRRLSVCARCGWDEHHFGPADDHDACPLCGEDIKSLHGHLPDCPHADTQIKTDGGQPTLHPQNDRIRTEALWREQPTRHPISYVSCHGETRHTTPLCPELESAYRTYGAETALYLFGESRCETCLHYRIAGDSGWTDPRYRRGETR